MPHIRLVLLVHNFLTGSSLTRERFAYIERTNNYSFVYVPGVNESDAQVYPSEYMYVCCHQLARL